LEFCLYGGVRVVFMEDLTLRFDELPDVLVKGKFFDFNNVEGYNIYPVGRTVSLLEFNSDKPLASVKIVEQSNYVLGGAVSTKGKYIVSNVSEEGKKLNLEKGMMR
jgi:hypothetical protein